MFTGRRTEILAALGGLAMICLTVLVVTGHLTVREVVAAVPGGVALLGTLTAAWRAERLSGNDPPKDPPSPA